MSKTDFVGVFAQLPESYQKEAILGCLKTMFTDGEWAAVSDMLGPIMEIPGQEKFKGDALAIGVNCALRLRDYELALARYRMLSALGGDMEFIGVSADALYQLAIQLLPERATQVFELWRPLVLPDMPQATQRTLGKIGE